MSLDRGSSWERIQVWEAEVEPGRNGSLGFLLVFKACWAGEGRGLLSGTQSIGIMIGWQSVYPGQSKSNRTLPDENPIQEELPMGCSSGQQVLSLLDVVIFSHEACVILQEWIF